MSRLNCYMMICRKYRTVHAHVCVCVYIGQQTKNLWYSEEKTKTVCLIKLMLNGLQNVRGTRWVSRIKLQFSFDFLSLWRVWVLALWPVALGGRVARVHWHRLSDLNIKGITKTDGFCFGPNFCSTSAITWQWFCVSLSDFNIYCTLAPCAWITVN